MDVAAAMEGGDQYMVDKEFELRKARREATMLALEQVTDAGKSPLAVLASDGGKSASSTASTRDAVRAMNKWRQQALVEALVGGCWVDACVCVCAPGWVRVWPGVHVVA